MRSLLLSSLAFFLTICFTSGSDEFTIVSRYPPSSEDAEVAEHMVKKGSPLELSCKASKKFNLCRWGRPGSQSSCGIFSTDDTKNCDRTGSMSHWRVERKDAQTCIMTIDSVEEEEVGEWNCELQSYPNKGGQYESAQEYTNVVLAHAPRVELRGPSELVVFEGKRAAFTCHAAGKPLPHTLLWTIGRRPIDDLQVDEEEQDGDVVSQVVSATVSRSDWDGKTLMCTAVTDDDEGNTIEADDDRTIRVEKLRSLSRAAEPALARSAGEFMISERHPAGLRDEAPASLVAPEMEVTYWCESSLPWHVCRWKRPDSTDPCGIFSDDVDGKSCSAVWKSSSGWRVRKEGDLRCSVTGIVSHMDEGEWNCELQSKPLLDEHNVYESDQQYFRLETVRAAVVDVDLPPEIDAAEGDEVELTVQVKDAYPLPEITWRINAEELKPELVSRTPAQTDSEGRMSFSQTVRYSARPQDSGKKLILTVTQIDAEGHAVEEVRESFLSVRAAPMPEPKQSMSTGIIAAIVAVACLILLAVILLFVAFRTGKLCFTQPAPVYVIDESKPEQGHIDIQTDPVAVSDSGNNATFGPAKPNRLWQEKDLKQGFNEDSVLLPQSVQQPSTYAPDETKAYNDEGIGSVAGSLQSLNTDADDKDWKDTLQVLGPKFEKLAGYVRGNDEDDEEQEDEDDALDQVVLGGGLVDDEEEEPEVQRGEKEKRRNSSYYKEDGEV